MNNMYATYKTRIAGIKHNDTVDGEGICVSVWMQGCPHHCEGCHNPETWDPNGGKEYYFEDLLKEVDRAITANGITRNLSILGGEPFAPQNQEVVEELIRVIKARHPMIKVYLWTGYTYEYLLEHSNHAISGIMCLVDVLIDGPFILSKRDISLPLRGSPNQRILIHDKYLKPMCFKEVDYEEVRDTL